MGDRVKTATREKGRQAEDIAADFLESSGYRIVERNFTCRIGEIDIIARENEELVFVEVRSRSSQRTVNPAYSVNRTKQHKIARVAQYYLATRCRDTPPSRFDVVIVNMGPTPDVYLIADAFQVEPGQFGY